MSGSLKYKVIKSEAQYNEYSTLLRQLASSRDQTDEIRDEIELLTLLIDKWDEDYNSFDDVDPITLLQSLMEESGLTHKDLASILGLKIEEVLDILNYKKGLSKKNIGTLSVYFKLSQSAFDRKYRLAN